MPPPTLAHLLNPANLTSPRWLSNITRRSLPGRVRDLLLKSVFYPACDTDGTALRLLSPYFCRFVFADPTVTEERVREDLQDIRGYDVVRSPETLTPQELDLPHDWGDAEVRARTTMDAEVVNPFAIWAVLKRRSDAPEAHGADYLSILHLGLEGVWCRENLYDLQKVVPSVLTLISPGHAYGGNRTDFTDPTAALLRDWVINKNLPPHLLVGYRTEYLNARGNGQSLADLYPICSRGEPHHGKGRAYLRCRSAPHPRRK